jgi:DNA polymerase III delta prime subunit
MSTLLSEVLRPTTFDDLVISDDIKTRLIKMRDTQNLMNMLFHGKPGSGKTSATKLFSESDTFDTITINGSLETSVAHVREQILAFTTSSSLFCQPKIVIIDEADYLSKNAQAALRKVIEDTSKVCRFVFTANNLSKIDPALRSRLLLVSFDMTASQIQRSLNAYKERVLKVLSEKSPTLNLSRATQIIDMHFPDYRSIANHLEFEYI